MAQSSLGSEDLLITQDLAFFEDDLPFARDDLSFGREGLSCTQDVLPLGQENLPSDPRAPAGPSTLAAPVATAGVRSADATVFQGPRAEPVAELHAETVAALALMLSSQRQGGGCLPYHLGLDEDAFATLMRHCFADAPDLLAVAAGRDPPAVELGELRQLRLELREDEWRDLRDLLLSWRASEGLLPDAMACILAAGCLGGAHLWRDLGLDSRARLSRLITDLFPGLAARNIHDMKWKRFFYRQLCETGCDRVCRAPDCQQCSAFSECFGSES